MSKYTDAVQLHFAARAESYRAESGQGLAAVEQRINLLRAGGRLTMSEARQIYNRALDEARLIGRNLSEGVGQAAQEEFDAAMDRAEAIRSGLLADGYDIDTPRALGDPEDTEVGPR